MRISIILSIFLVSLNLLAADDAKMKELFKKYKLVMNAHKTELVEEVFSKKFLKENGGKDKFSAEVKELPKVSEKSIVVPDISWRKGLIDEIYFAKLKKGTSEFIIIKEDGKLKIDGTLSDAE